MHRVQKPINGSRTKIVAVELLCSAEKLLTVPQQYCASIDKNLPFGSKNSRNLWLVVACVQQHHMPNDVRALCGTITLLEFKLASPNAVYVRVSGGKQTTYGGVCGWLRDGRKGIGRKATIRLLSPTLFCSSTISRIISHMQVIHDSLVCRSHRYKLISSHYRVNKLLFFFLLNRSGTQTIARIWRNVYTTAWNCRGTHIESTTTRINWMACCVVR